jgi:hypothetical protein
MEAAKSESCLPRVHVVPPVVMMFAVARAMQSVYADVLREELPDKLSVFIRELDTGARSRA